MHLSGHPGASIPTNEQSGCGVAPEEQCHSLSLTLPGTRGVSEEVT